MTERLYYTDSYQTEFRAKALQRDATSTRLVLDRTLFYPSSGGQPNDIGVLGGVRVVDVLDEENRIVHVLESPLLSEAELEGCIDWSRRFDHMQQHSGQHLLSAVAEELYGVKTVGFHLGEESSTIDLQTASLSPAQIEKIESRANEAIWENRPLTVSFEDSAEAGGLRKESTRQGTLRIVSISGMDRSACGGTHVRATGEIGSLAIRKLDRIRGNVRVEFLCGGRAQRRARADFDALSQIARQFSGSLDEAPGLVAAQVEQLKESEKARRKMALDLALMRGRDLYSATEADASGRRTRIETRKSGALDDEVRALAQSFCAQPKAVFIVILENPASVLLATSADSGIHAGETLKPLLAQAGGRGGGNAQMAQGSVPTPEALSSLAGKLAHL